MTWRVASLVINILDLLLSSMQGSDWCDSELEDSVVKNIKAVLKTVVVTLAVLFVADNIGFEVSSLVTGLGVGGIVIALSSQAILADIIPGVSMMITKPFTVGDCIKVGERIGIVQNIGLKDTKVRSLDGECFIYPNRYMVHLTPTHSPAD